MKIGLVGLGLVGTALAGRLKAAGFEVIGLDVRPAACAAFTAAGGQLVDSLPAMAAQVSCVVLAVFDTQGVLAVVEGGNGLLDAPAPASASASASTTSTVRCFIDCSTSDPEALLALSLRLKARGIDFIEAPLSGSSRQIAEGQATLLLGGEADAIAAYAPVLKALAAQRLHVGPAGMGARAKLATNLVLGLNRAAFAEGLVFAERLGIAPAQFLQLVLSTPARSDAAAIKGPLMVSGSFAAQSRIRQHLKDVDLMLQSARQAGQKLPLSEAHATLMRAALAAGDGDLDNAAIVRQLRRETYD